MQGKALLSAEGDRVEISEEGAAAPQRFETGPTA
jgi:hypothetical protein